YNVSHVTATNRYNYTSSSVFTDNLVFFQAPIWIAVKTNDKFDPANNTAKLESLVGGVPVASPQFTYENSTGSNFISTNGELVFKITNMPAGEQTLRITVSNDATPTSEIDVKEIPITFIPTPFIEYKNLRNGQEFDDPNAFTSITAKLYNFNLSTGSADLQSVKAMVNGTEVAIPPGSIS